MKKKIIYLSAILVLVISLITLSSIYKSKDNKYKKEYNTISKGMAIMIKEEGATDYVQSNSKDIPKGNYVLNEEKTHCENNGKVTNYNSATGKISINFIGSDRCYLYFDYYSGPKGWETILLNNGNGATTVDEAKAYISGKGTPTFANVAKTNEGMYATDDDYTATTGMKSYYFRGAVDNNWVKFGEVGGKPIYWRIIRINGDGSIRMIYSGTTAPTESTKVVMTGDGTQIGKSVFNSNYNKSEYVGYMYTNGEQHGNSTSSTIKTTIENWYAETTLKDNPFISQNQIFCNDRSSSSAQSVTWSSGKTYDYGATGRLEKNKTPILTCPEEVDKFTSKDSTIGNKMLEYPVGLITADEIAMAGGAYGFSNTNSSYYLYTDQGYWLGSADSFNSVRSYAFEFNVANDGRINTTGVDYNRGARPVISLSSKAKLSGNGTYNDVYRVVTDDSTEETPSDKSFDTVFAANNTDIFPENGIRYEGADPNNYICLDNKTSGACSSSSLLFRIIGLFDEDTSTDGTNSSGTKKLLKVIDTNNYGGTSGKYWNSAGTNNWSTASLKTELNETYLTTLLGTTNINGKLSSAIANAKWHLGGANDENYNTLTAEGIFTEERNTSAIYSGNPSSIYAKIGLIYPSDYGYATVGGTTTNKSSCRAKELYNWNSSSHSDCKNNDWIFTSQVSSWGSNKTEWLLSPYSSLSNSAAFLRSTGYVNLIYTAGDNQFAVRPAFYLDSSILKIVGTGDGTKDNAYRVG